MGGVSDADYESAINRRHQSPPTFAGAPLPPPCASGNVLTMYALARLLQVVGLTLPPLAIVAQLSEAITLGQMLQFLVAAICLFTIGYLIQQSTSKPK